MSRTSGRTAVRDAPDCMNKLLTAAHTAFGLRTSSRNSVRQRTDASGTQAESG